MDHRIAPVGWLTLALLLACACASPPAVERAQVSSELELRTGAGLASSDEDGTVPELPPGVVLSDELDERECVALALWHDPSFQAALAELEVARARVGAAGRLKDPSFLYLFAVGPKTVEWLLWWPIQDLWERPKRVSAAQRDAERVAADLVRRGLQLVLDVEREFAACVLAREQLAAASEIVDLQRRAEEITQSRLEAGDADPLEREAARTAVLMAREDERQLARQLALARATLAVRLGGELEEELPFEQLELRWHEREGDARELAPEEPLVARALALHSDARAAEAALALASDRLGLAKAEIMTVDVGLDANERDGGGMELGPGVRFTLPIFDGGRGKRSVAEAELVRAGLEYEAARQRVALAARRASIELDTAEEALASWRDETQAGVGRLAEVTAKACAAGDLPPARAVDAELALVRARQRAATLEAAWHVAWAELEYSVGGRLQPAGEEVAP